MLWKKGDFQSYGKRHLTEFRNGACVHQITKKRPGLIRESGIAVSNSLGAIDGFVLSDYKIIQRKVLTHTGYFDPNLLLNVGIGCFR